MPPLGKAGLHPEGSQTPLPAQGPRPPLVVLGTAAPLKSTQARPGKGEVAGWGAKEQRRLAAGVSPGQTLASQLAWGISRVLSDFFGRRPVYCSSPTAREQVGPHWLQRLTRRQSGSPRTAQRPAQAPTLVLVPAGPSGFRRNQPVELETGRWPATSFAPPPALAQCEQETSSSGSRTKRLGWP